MKCVPSDNSANSSSDAPDHKPRASERIRAKMDRHNNSKPHVLSSKVRRRRRFGRIVRACPEEQQLQKPQQEQESNHSFNEEDELVDIISVSPISSTADSYSQLSSASYPYDEEVFKGNVRLLLQAVNELENIVVRIKNIVSPQQHHSSPSSPMSKKAVRTATSCKHEHVGSPFGRSMSSTTTTTTTTTHRASTV